MRSLKGVNRLGLVILMLLAWVMVAQATGFATPADVYTGAGGMYSAHQLQHASGMMRMMEGVFGACLVVGAFCFML